MKKVRKLLNLLIGLLILGVTQAPFQVFGQNASIKGIVKEQIIRPDGKEILRNLKDVKVYIREYPDRMSYTDAKGRFSLSLNQITNKGNLNLVFEKRDYDLMENKTSHKAIPYFALSNQSLNSEFTVYLSKENKDPNNRNVTSKNDRVSGFIKDKDKGISDIEVRVQGADGINTYSTQDGFFELYVPNYLLEDSESFTLILTKDDQSERVSFENYNAFSLNGIIDYESIFPKEETALEDDTNEEEGDNRRVELDEITEVEEMINIEEKFKNFLDELDRKNFRSLSEGEIRVLKDSLRSYARFLTNIIAPTDSVERIRLEKQVTEYRSKLIEKEKELVASESANKDKTIVILSLALVALTLSFLSYYYFYVSKKIKSQAHELTKRHQFIEYLLRELNHRVTNNLQVIQSMLRRKMRRISDENAKQVLKEIQGRVMDISTVHTGLYSNTSRNEKRIIKIHEYLNNITMTLKKLYGFEDQSINIHIKTPDIDIEHRNAVFFGLVVNELVTNAFKYAFEGVENPELSIELRKQNEEKFYLKVEDNGQGIPTDFRLQDAKSSGLKLVQLITQMLDGSFNMSSVDGTQFELVFTMK